MTERIVGWTVRTHDGVQERLWRVGVPERDKAERMAARAAHAGSQAISPVTQSHRQSVWRLAPGAAREITTMPGPKPDMTARRLDQGSGARDSGWRAGQLIRRPSAPQ